MESSYEEPQTSGVCTRLKAALIEFSTNTSAHGPPKIVGARYILTKLIWTVLFLTGIGVFTYFSTKLIINYLEFQTTTDMKLQFRQLEFPAVTICNLNQFRKDRLPTHLMDLADEYLEERQEDLLGGEDEYNEYQAKNSGNSGSTVTASSAGSSSTTKYQPTAATGNVTTARTWAILRDTARFSAKRRKKRQATKIDEERMKVVNDLADSFYYEPDVEEVMNMSWFNNVGKIASEKSVLLNLTHTLADYTVAELSGMGHDIQEMLQECTFLGANCGPKDFYQFYDKLHGNCYTFNSGVDGEVQEITTPGSMFGLSLTLFVNQAVYIPALSTQAGIRIMLHRQGEVPLIAEDGFNVSPGTKSAVAVKYVEISRQPGTKFSGCTDQTRSPKDGGLHEFYPGNYTQKACIKTCLQKGIIKECGCANPLYRHPASTKVCTPAEFDCSERAEAELVERNSCQKSCPLPCWESQYQYTISSSQWPSNSYKTHFAKLLKERGSFISEALQDEEVGLAQQFVKLEVFYDNLNYIVYSEKESMTVEDLVGAIGGHLGLWIGMSILSFVEVLELIVDLFKVITPGICGNRVIDSQK